MYLLQICKRNLMETNEKQFYSRLKWPKSTKLMPSETCNEFAVTYCVFAWDNLCTFGSMWVSEQHFAAEVPLSLPTSLDSDSYMSLLGSNENIYA